MTRNQLSHAIETNQACAFIDAIQSGTKLELDDVVRIVFRLNRDFASIIQSFEEFGVDTGITGIAEEDVFEQLKAFPASYPFIRAMFL